MTDPSPDGPIEVKESAKSTLAIQGVVLVGFFALGYVTCLFATGANVFDFVLLHQGVVAPIGTAAGLWLWRARVRVKEHIEKVWMAHKLPNKVAVVIPAKPKGDEA